jgi:dTDP-4-dehydrorhamnose 3,5-epimerase
MIFTETKLRGAYIIELEPVQDERGFFARSFCQHEFEQHGLNFQIVQCNLSYNKKKGTLRGMHYQIAPYQEAKIVSCIQGAMYDVIIDLRPDSPTYCQWSGVELTQEKDLDNVNPLLGGGGVGNVTLSSYTMLYVPEGFAHGFQTLEDHAVVFYQMSEFYYPECARGVRWDDPRFAIQWPLPITGISVKDQTYPDFVGIG